MADMTQRVIHTSCFGVALIHPLLSYLAPTPSGSAVELLLAFPICDVSCPCRIVKSSSYLSYGVVSAVYIHLIATSPRHSILAVASLRVFWLFYSIEHRQARRTSHSTHRSHPTGVTWLRALVTF